MLSGIDLSPACGKQRLKCKVQKWLFAWRFTESKASHGSPLENMRKLIFSFSPSRKDVVIRFLRLIWLGEKQQKHWEAKTVTKHWEAGRERVHTVTTSCRHAIFPRINFAPY